jgi:adenosylhomocysteine nucleosidase
LAADWRPPFLEKVIAVTFALPAESSDFLRRLSNQSRTDRNGIRIIRGNIDDREIQVLHTGVGERVCRERLEKFLEDQQFDLLISTGFAGALNDQLQIGDLLLAKNFSTVHLNEERSFSTLPIHTGDLLTVPALIDSSEERNNVAHASGATAVDMETEFIARACAARGVALLSVRVITDTPREPFPAPPNVLFDIQQQRTDALRFARFFVAHPRRIAQLVRFAKRIARARTALADALVKVLRNVEL